MTALNCSTSDTARRRNVGVAYDAHVPPPVFDSDASFFVTRREMERLGRSSDYDQIKAVLPNYDEDRAKELAVDINDRLELLDIGHGAKVYPENLKRAGANSLHNSYLGNLFGNYRRDCVYDEEQAHGKCQ